MMTTAQDRLAFVREWLRVNGSDHDPEEKAAMLTHITVAIAALRHITGAIADPDSLTLAGREFASLPAFTHQGATAWMNPTPN